MTPVLLIIAVTLFPVVLANAQGSCISVRVAEAQRLLRAGERKVLVTGRVTGFDGKPARKAHAHFRRRAWGPAMPYSYTVEAAPDGSYRMKLPEGLYDVSFTGVDHQETGKYPVFFSGERDNRIDARLPLSPFRSIADLDTVIIMYTDILTMREVEARMRRVAPGVYEYEAPVDPLQGTVAYHLWGIMPGRRVNGTQAHYYKYDKGGDYQSVHRLLPGDTVLRVRFDHALLPVAGPEQPWATRDSVWGAPLRHPLAQVVRRIGIVQQELRELNEAGLAGIIWPDRESLLQAFQRDESVRYIQAVPFFAADSLYDFSPDSLQMVRVVTDSKGDTLSTDSVVVRRSEHQTHLIEREIAAMEEYASDTTGVEAGACFLPVLEALRQPYWLKKAHLELMREAFATIPPSSRLWTLSQTFTAAGELPFTDSLRYLLRMTREQENERVVVEAYRKLFSVLRRRIEEAESGRAAKGPWRELRDSLYAAVKECFDGTEHQSTFIMEVEGVKAWTRHLIEQGKAMETQAKQALAWMPADTLAGRPMPDFRYPLLDASGEEVTREGMLGKTYVLTITTPHAMPVYFLGMLDEAVRMYGDSGLVGVFVIQDSDTARIRGYLDYLASCGILEGRRVGCILVPGEEFDERPYSARFAAQYYLVDDEGIIRASGGRLSAEFAFPTLRKYFEEATAR